MGYLDVMQEKIMILAVGILTAAMFTMTLVVTVNLAFADGAGLCSPRNPNVCVFDHTGATTTGTSNPDNNGARPGCAFKNGQAFGPGC
jgi:hypothetical protein